MLEGARGGSADEPHRDRARQIRDRQRQAVQRHDRDHRRDHPGADQIGQRPDGLRFQCVDLLGDTHGAELCGESATRLCREGQGGQHRTELAGGGEGRDGTGQRAQTEQVQRAVALDGDGHTAECAQDQNHADGATTDNQAAVTPGDIGEQAPDFFRILLERQRHRADRPQKEEDLVADPREPVPRCTGGAADPLQRPQ